MTRGSRPLPEPLQRASRPFRKLRLLLSYPAAVKKRPRLALKYLLFDRETGNFTYEIANAGELASSIGAAFTISAQIVARYIAELEDNTTLRSALNARLQQRSDRNPVALYGRRSGWYAIARLTKPRLAVETGVHDGLGSTVLLEALRQNAGEHHPGRLVGIDIDPTAGWLIPDYLRQLFTLVAGNSLDALPNVANNLDLDLLIHDSDHRASYEAAEYEAVTYGLSSRAVLLSDNAHASSALAEFSQRHGRRFYYWREQASGHFYPGAGLGISLVREP